MKRGLLLGMLKASVGARQAESVLGDLEERRAQASSRSIGAFRFWCEGIGLATYFAGVRLADAGRDAWRSGGLWRGFSREVRHSGRALRHAPWYASTVFVMMTVAMALATTVFAVVDGVLFRPLSYARPSELFVVRGAFSEYPAAAPGYVSARDVREWASAAPEVSFATMALAPRQIGERDESPEPVRAAAVDARFLEVLGVQPIFGGFGADDFRPGAPRTPAVVTFGFWRRALGGDRSVIGRAITLASGATIRIAGVLPEEFVYPTADAIDVPDVLVPLIVPADAADNLRRRSYDVIARVPHGVSPADVRARLGVRSTAIAHEFPVVPLRPSLSAMSQRALGPFDAVWMRPLTQHLGSRERVQSAVVLGSVLVLVLLACVNMTGLTLARAEDRRREFALRRALGATGWMLARSAFIEVGLLVALAAMAAIALARPVLALTLRLLPDAYLLLKTPAIDARVLLFVALLGFVAAIGAAMSPALAAARNTPARLLAAGGYATTKLAFARVRRLLVPAQVAIGFILIVGGVLLTTSLLRVWRESVGFDVDGLSIVEVRPAHADGAAAADRMRDVIAGIARLPGVVGAAGAGGELIRRGGGFDGTPFVLPVGNIFTGGVTKAVPVTPGFFAVARPRLIAGRLPDDAEVASGARVVVLSQRVADEYWPGRQAVGQTLDGHRGIFTVVGVVADARLYALDRGSEGEMYLSIGEESPSTILVRSRPGLSISLADVSRVATAVHAENRVTRVTPMLEAMGESIRPRRFQSWLFGTLGGAAMMLVGVGMFGLLAMSTARRTREIGIRVALGSTRDGVIRLLLREQLSAIVGGLVTGGLASAWFVQFLRASLYQTAVYDPTVWMIAVVLIATTAIAGTLMPAIRASRVDPVKALGQE